MERLRHRSFVFSLALATVISAGWLGRPARADQPDDDPATSVRIEPGSPLAEGGIAGGAFAQDFESGFVYGSGCNQQGWLCGTPPSNWSIVNAGIAGFGAFTARDTSSGSGVGINGGELHSPVFPITTDRIEADILITDATNVFQFNAINTLSGASGFVNTRLSFETNGTITALQSNVNCSGALFHPTTGNWTPNVKMRIGFEVETSGSLKVYKDGVEIFTGQDIAQICGAGDPDEGITQLRNFNFNNGTTAAFLLDNVGPAPTVNPCSQPLPTCRADIHPLGEGDGIVNVLDLLAVIGTWGQNGNPSGPRPQGDTAPPPTGDCQVNVVDLLAVISGWGDCPTPIGACCLFDGSCLESQTAAACASAGGAFQGDGAFCAGVTCTPFPLNDECGGAITVNNGPNNISNLSATNSSFPPPPGVPCTSGGAGNFTRDVWFNYTATCDQTVEIGLCATTGAVTDTVLAVYTGDCANLVQVGCDDDSCAEPGPPNLRSQTSVAVTAGQQLKIRVGSWQASPAGNMILTIACTQPDNDFCDQATPLAVGGSASDSLANATLDTAPVCNDIEPANGRWYTVTGNGNTLIASTCTGPQQFWNARLSVYCGANCDNLFCITAADENSCNVFQETVSWCSIPDQTYWILVHSVDGPVDGNYTLTIEDGGKCTDAIACALSNDECSGAITAVNGQNFGTNAGATTSAGIPGGACASPSDPANFTRDVWFKYTAPSSGVFMFDTCVTFGVVTDTVVAVLSGSCAALTELACDDDTCGDKDDAYSRAVATLTAGQQVFVRVGSWSDTAEGPFTLTIGPAPPACSTFACPGGSQNEGEPCLTAAPDTVNGGCNSDPTVYGTITANGPAKCGTISTFLNGAVNNRDTDWFKFTVSTPGTYHIDVNAQFTAQVAIFADVTNPGVACVDTFQFPGSALITTSPQLCTTVSSPTVTLQSGEYAVVVTSSVFSGYPCAGGANNYWVKLVTP